MGSLPLQLKNSDGENGKLKGGVNSPPATNFATLHNQVVFDDTVSIVNTWQDLDLSAWVGANSALCFFQIGGGGGDDFVLKMKPKGYGGAVADHPDDGVAGWDNTTTSKRPYLICFTDNSGVLQIAANTILETIMITLVGLIK